MSNFDAATTTDHDLGAEDVLNGHDLWDLYTDAEDYKDDEDTDEEDRLTARDLYNALSALETAVGNLRDVTLIHADYFTEYAKEYATDIGAVSSDTAWPCNHIDWEAAADDLRTDYSCVQFGGADFYYC